MRTAGFTGNLAATEIVCGGGYFGPNTLVTTNASTGAIAGAVADIPLGFDTVVLKLTGAQGGGVNYTLPTVAAMINALQPPSSWDAIGSSFFLRIINVGSGQIITVTTNTGWTLVSSGVFTIANNTYRDFVLTINSGTPTATLENVGTGTWS